MSFQVSRKVGFFYLVGGRTRLDWCPRGLGLDKLYLLPKDLKASKTCLQINLMVCCAVMSSLIYSSDFPCAHLDLFASTLAFPLWFLFYLFMSCVIVLLFVMHCFYSGHTHTHPEGQEGWKPHNHYLLWSSADVWDSIITAQRRHLKWKRKEDSQRRKTRERRKRPRGGTLNYEAKKCSCLRQQDVRDAAAVRAWSKTGSWLEISEKIHKQFSPQHQRFLPLRERSDAHFYSSFHLWGVSNDK